MSDQNEEMECIKLLAEIRFACGDNGKRMQDELVQYIAELYRQAEIVEHLMDRVCYLEAVVSYLEAVKEQD